MLVRIKKLCESAVVPCRAHVDDACYDLYATSFEEVDGCAVYGTGLSFEIPRGYVGLIFQRSSVASKDIILTNAVGVIDSGYRGEVMFKFKPVWRYRCSRANRPNSPARVYGVGDRIGQIMIVPVPDIEFELSDCLSETERGAGGYGSSGV